MTSCQVANRIKYKCVGLENYKSFPSRDIKSPTNHFNFIVDTSSFSQKINGMTIDKFLENTNTVSFIVIKNDTIKYEKYFDSYNNQSLINSFSISNSITSILIGCAIEDGFITSINEPITNYIPNLSDEFKTVTIKHLLQMTSGIDYNYPYSTPSIYFCDNLRKKITTLKLQDKPGTVFVTNRVNTQLLGFILESALKGKTLSNYLQERIWKPMGMEFDATWSLDKSNSIERAFCGINATARDFAKIGSLYKNKGYWNGKQIISKDWVEESIKLDTSDGSPSFYQYQWWVPTPGEDFLAESQSTIAAPKSAGQYIYVNSKKNLVIVRFGKGTSGISWWEVFSKLQ